MACLAQALHQPLDLPVELRQPRSVAPHQLGNALLGGHGLLGERRMGVDEEHL